jgi:hypothetical protein
MKTIKKNKLSLSTETLAPLTGNDLDGVAGGNGAGAAISQTVSQITRTLLTVGCAPPTLACPTLRCLAK